MLPEPWGQSEPSHLRDTGDEGHPLWKSKRLSPSRIIVRDFNLEPYKKGKSSSDHLLSCDNVDLSNITRDALRYEDKIERIKPGIDMVDWERSKVELLLRDYGWMESLRVEDPPFRLRCRWIHISSTFPEHLQGILLAMGGDQETAIRNCRVLEDCINQNERFSKHGKYFSPFIKELGEGFGDEQAPLLISLPFLDWTVFPGPAPKPRYQVDPKADFLSSKSAAHPIRSVLQYFYRLENTKDREKDQVFNRYKPWANDSGMNSKIRLWYGEIPSGLAVDEMWILVLDSRHIVTFSNNQSWKPRRPSHQLFHRIQDIQFRGIRNSFHVMGKSSSYNAYTHMIACISGAVGLLHWSFWADIVLPLTDRFSGYLSHLQYRLHRSPSTRLVMDLLAVQDEFGIVNDIVRKQWNLIAELKVKMEEQAIIRERIKSMDDTSTGTDPHQTIQQDVSHRFRQFSASSLADPFLQLQANLDREYSDLRDLRNNCEHLVTRTVQLVNIRLEDHGKAILVFTIVTIIFLPLSFIASFFGMNTADIRNTTHGQGLFWAVAASVTAVIVGAASFLAFYGSKIVEYLSDTYTEYQKRKSKRRAAKNNHITKISEEKTSVGFKVLNATRLRNDRDGDLTTF